MRIGLDYYDRHARLKPALILVLPCTLAILAFSPDEVVGLPGAIALVVQAGGSFLVAQIVGDIGKQREAWLFKKEGGRPTEILLSHSGAPNRTVLRIRHSKLGILLPEVRIPSRTDEEADKPGAFDVYEACTAYVRTRARDQSKFSGVFRENVNFGFRRNLWAIKPVGLIVSGIGVLVMGSELYESVAAHRPISLFVSVVALSEVVLFLVWIFAITPSWVTRAGKLYAEALLEALDQF